MKLFSFGGVVLVASLMSIGSRNSIADEPPALVFPVQVELVEGIPDGKAWDLSKGTVTETYREPAFGLVGTPQKFTAKGIRADCSNPFLLRATAEVTLPAGEYRLLLRSRNAARVFIGDDVIVTNKHINPNADGHEEVPELPVATEPDLVPMGIGQQEQIVTITSDGTPKTIRLEAIIGGQKLRLEPGEISISVAAKNGGFRLLSTTPSFAMTEDNWSSYVAAARLRFRDMDRLQRRQIAADEVKYWDHRHELARREIASRPALEIPQVSSAISVNNDVDRFIAARLAETKTPPAALSDDWSFLRRVYLDTVGVIPTREEIATFFAEEHSVRRARVIDKLLADPRWADHWMSYWQDVLAENPGILKPTLNNTGPFRWWLHDSLVDDKPMDRLVTELVLMEGSSLGGGAAGFGIASENDAPLASKAHILGKAFLGIEMQCARCHDAPFHPFEQQDLFSLAAMLGKGTQTIPATSSLPAGERERRPLVQVTLEPGAKVPPAWPFAEFVNDDIPEGVLRNEKDSRERLAALFTSPRNDRFAHVLVNRVWKRYLNTGLVEPVDDWASGKASHPGLLEYLAREFVSHDYNLKHVARLILNSHTYQRTIDKQPVREERPQPALFASPARRRLSAEQLVDSLFVAVKKEFGSELLTFDPEGRRPASQMINLGLPTRAWQFTSLSNERDRPALALPIAQSFVDLLIEFGWRDSRQFPLTVRDETATPLQPLVLANGIIGTRIARLSDDSLLTKLSLEDRPLPELVREVYLALLTRPPSDDELGQCMSLLSEGYDQRIVKDAPVTAKKKQSTTVSWANHLSAEATRIKIQLEKQAREGDPPTARLARDWRERMEDVAWSLINSPEFIFTP